MHSGNLGPALRSQKKTVLAAFLFVLKSPRNFTALSNPTRKKSVSVQLRYDDPE